MSRANWKQIDKDLHSLYVEAADFGEKKAIMDQRIEWEKAKMKALDDGAGDYIPAGLKDEEIK